MPGLLKTRSCVGLAHRWLVVCVGFSGFSGRFVGRMCDFHKTGTCMAGDLCRFAHEARVILSRDEKEASLVREK